MLFSRCVRHDDYFSFTREFNMTHAHARQLESLALASKSRWIVLLEGKGVTGKTSLVRHLAFLRGKRLLVVSGKMGKPSVMRAQI